MRRGAWGLLPQMMPQENPGKIPLVLMKKPTFSLDKTMDLIYDKQDLT